MNYKHSLGNFNNKEIKKVFNTDERVCIDCNENIEETPSFAFDAAPGPTRAYLTCPNCKTEYTVKKEKLTELYIDIFEYQ